MSGWLVVGSGKHFWRPLSRAKDDFQLEHGSLAAAMALSPLRQMFLWVVYCYLLVAGSK